MDNTRYARAQYLCYGHHPPDKQLSPIRAKGSPRLEELQMPPQDMICSYPVITVIPTLLVSLPKSTCHQKFHCSFQDLYVAAHFTSPRQSMSISLQVLYQIASNKIPTAHLGVPLEAHAIVMGVRQKPRRCDVLSSWAGHFAPPTKHPWESLSMPMQSLWGSGGKRVGAMCYYHGRAILLPPTKHPWESLSMPMQSLWGSGGKRVGAMCYYHGRAILLPPTKHPWESLSMPMQSLWGSGEKRVGAMCYYHGRAILLPPPNTPGSPSRGPCSIYGAPAENASVQCAAIAGWPLCSPH
ncbi:hypothetical protein B0H13DRAFT_184206 [Mycena leptocephala]|nr:hypothetical protein B0H13DRAFT_184206 [Mycena leptocephala]